MATQETNIRADAPDPKQVYRRKLRLSLSIFFIFFVVYIGTAVIQTPQMKSLAGIPVFGMPLGLLLSLCVFPLSWILIAVYFRLGR